MYRADLPVSFKDWFKALEDRMFGCDAPCLGNVGGHDGALELDVDILSTILLLSQQGTLVKKLSCGWSESKL